MVKGFAQESVEIQRFAEQNSDWLKTSEESVRIRAINDPLVVLIANLATIFIIWYGGRLVDVLTLGELIAFNAYMSQLTGRSERWPADPHTDRGRGKRPTHLRDS